ncbi:MULTISPECIES: cation:proton antiporter [Acidiplasma]|jgi:Kef-type K+ transport system membrane component KefB|uniref:Sodium:proton antiporter n=1 Tax=Acidiplasma aeolicum TaxID=507754 RepID=A0A0Q1B2T8_9ARCH|nr:MULTISPECIES: cation:proton antiporter [Acidiplasma]KJE49287.1 sodium:proton antiporter [Acidiplasma sp. MBA-1]KQB34070.1 sodium:proton antiporter [Acidiplasma aeolicum]WMT54734.1 MAG: cation:proton antiporter [Acidiplasma sp.]
MYGISDSVLALMFLGTLLLLAKLGEEIFERLKLVPYVAAIVFGIIIGPGVLGLINVLPNISLFISIGINFLLFSGGALEFKNVDTKKLMNYKNIILGVIEFFIPFSLISYFVFLILHSLLIAIVTGIVTGMSSAGPLTRLLSDTGLNKTEEGNKIFQEVVTIEISAVILFSFISDFHNKPITFINVLLTSLELIASIVVIILFSKYILIRLLEKMDANSKAHETTIAIIIGFIFILGFIGELYGFNSAIVALFIGIILRDFINDRPIIAEKISTVTYGLFEPLFFIGLGLYFVKITPALIILGLLIFAIALLIKPIAGFATSKIIKVQPWKNALGTSVNGGVDAALLVVALTLSLVGRYDYSIIMIAITLLTLMVPLLFNINAPVIPVKKSRYVWEIVNSEFKNLKACDIAKTLQTVSVNVKNPISLAFKICTDLNSRAVIVTNSNNRVVGELLLSDMVTLGENKLRTYTVSQGRIVPAIKVRCNAPATDLIKIFRETDPPIVAVVDERGKFIGTILEREILKHISDVLSREAE